MAEIGSVDQTMESFIQVDNDMIPQGMETPNDVDDVYMCVAAVISDSVVNQLSAEQLVTFEDELSLVEAAFLRQHNKCIIYGSQDAVQKAKTFLNELVSQNVINQTDNDHKGNIKEINEEQEHSNSIPISGGMNENIQNQDIVNRDRLSMHSEVNDTEMDKFKRTTRGKKVDVLSVLGKKRKSNKISTDEEKRTNHSKRKKDDPEINDKKMEAIKADTMTVKEENYNRHDVDIQIEKAESTELSDEASILLLKVEQTEQESNTKDENEGETHLEENSNTDENPKVHVEVNSESCIKTKDICDNKEQQQNDKEHQQKVDPERKVLKRKFEDDVLKFLKKVSSSKKKRKAGKKNKVIKKTGAKLANAGDIDGKATEDDTLEKRESDSKDTTEENHVCDICGHQTKTVHAMRIHSYNYHQEHRHECDICFGTYSMKYMLLRHRQYHFEKDGTLKVAAMALHKVKLAELGRPETLPPDLVKQIEDAGVPDIPVTVDTEDSTEEAQDVVCPVCFTTLSNAYYLTLHMKTVHLINKRNKSETEYMQQAERYQNGVKQNVFNCPKCSFKTSRIQNFTSHFNVHIKPSMYYCDLCSYSNKKKAEVNRHKRNAHDERNFQCDRCNTKFRNQPQLTSHIKQKHTLSYSRMCAECGKVLSTAYSYKHHIESHHADPAIQPGDKIMCQKCGRIFRTIGAFQGHLKKYHANVDDDSLLREEKIVSEGVLVLDEGNLFQCKTCLSYSNTSAREVRQHIVRVHLERKYRCIHCEKSFPRPSFLNRHIALHHLGLESVDCPECDKTFKNKNYLAYHRKRIHQKRTAFDCDVCQKSFFRRVDYDTHLEVHKPEDERRWKYECEICQKRFRFKSNIDYHMLEHTGLKAFDCPICKQSFKTNTIRNSHILSHNSERPYTCPQCDKSYKLQKYLDVHLLTHSGERYACRACCRLFPHKKSLEKHICRAVKLSMDQDQLQKMEIMSGNVDIDAASMYTIPDVPDPSTLEEREENHTPDDGVSLDEADDDEQSPSISFTHAGGDSSAVVAWSGDIEQTSASITTDAVSQFQQDILQPNSDGVISYINLPTESQTENNTALSGLNIGTDQQGDTVIYEAKNTKEAEEFLQLVKLGNQSNIKLILSGDTSTSHSIAGGLIDTDDNHLVNTAETGISPNNVSDNADVDLQQLNEQCEMNSDICSGEELAGTTDGISVVTIPYDVGDSGTEVYTVDQESKEPVYMCGICHAQFNNTKLIELHVLHIHAQKC